MVALATAPFPLARGCGLDVPRAPTSASSRGMQLHAPAHEAQAEPMRQPGVSAVPLQYAPLHCVQYWGPGPSQLLQGSARARERFPCGPRNRILKPTALRDLVEGTPGHLAQTQGAALGRIRHMSFAWLAPNGGGDSGESLAVASKICASARRCCLD